MLEFNPDQRLSLQKFNEWMFLKQLNEEYLIIENK